MPRIHLKSAGIRRRRGQRLIAKTLSVKRPVTDHRLGLSPGEIKGGEMSASGNNAAPVIIKRKKVVKGDGHHGGAWKVAIAFSFSLWRFAPVKRPAPRGRRPQAVFLTCATGVPACRATLTGMQGQHGAEVLMEC